MIEKLIRENFSKICKNLKKRNFFLNKKIFFELYFKKQFLKKTLNILNENLNKKKFNLKEKYFIDKIIKLFKYFLKKIEYKTKNFLIKIPNLVNENISKKNLIIKLKYKKKIEINFKNHIEIGKIYGLDLELSKTLSGYGYEVIKNPLSNLYDSLMVFIKNLHKFEHNYKEIFVPYLINSNSLINSGLLPKFFKNLFKINIKNEVFLIPTSEVSLINLFNNKIIKSNNLPIKIFSLTKCFRNEKKNYGKINKGLIRQFQFDKIELLQITNQKSSYKDLNELIKHAEKILYFLKIPYRIILISEKNIGKTSSKTFDIEIWLPSINNFCEISSCSNNENYQSIKLKNKYIYKNKKKFTHIINGSGLAVGRLFSSILENKQNINGYIKIPKIFKKKFIFLNKIF